MFYRVKVVWTEILRMQSLQIIVHIFLYALYELKCVVSFELSKGVLETSVLIKKMGKSSIYAW